MFTNAKVLFLKLITTPFYLFVLLLHRVYISKHNCILIMSIYEIFFFLISLVLMPFFTHGEPWYVKLFFLGLSMLFTPIIGIPLYRYFAK